MLRRRSARSLVSSLLHVVWAGLQLLVVGWFGLQLLVVGGLGVFELSRRLARGRLAGDGAPLTVSRVTVYLLALSVIAYTMAISCLVHHGEPRFRTVTDPLIVLLCFLGSSVWHRLLVSTECGLSDDGRRIRELLSSRAP